MDIFPSDIKIEILSRLPAKSVVRFKCVCRSWRSLLSHPDFARKHYMNANKDDVNSFLAFNDVSLYRRAEFSWSNGDEKLLESVTMRAVNDKLRAEVKSFGKAQIANSCHGILCLLLPVEGAVVLWNPCINEYLRLPLPESFDYDDEIFGFGYDPSTHIYKAVRVPSIHRPERRPSRVTLQVLNLTNSGSWRSVHNHFPSMRIYKSSWPRRLETAVFLNRSLYWVAFDPGDKTFLVRFDLSEERFWKVAPPFGLFSDLNFYLCILGGELCVIDRLCTQTHSLNIWVMKEEDNWSRVYTIPFFIRIESMNDYFTPIYYYSYGRLPYNHFRPCFFFNNAHEVVIHCSLIKGKSGGGDYSRGHEKMFFVYNFPRNCYRRVNIIGDSHWTQAIAYTQTLISPCSFGSTDMSMPII